MQTISSFENLTDSLKGRRSCLTIGVFDGVHLGHQTLVNATVERARATGDVPVAVTFSNHPLSILAPPYSPLQLTTPARKAQLLHQLGLEIVVMLEFTPVLASVDPHQFIEHFLVEQAAVRHLICGYDFTFGRLGAGNFEMLTAAGAAFDFEATSFGPVCSQNHPVKSTHIRDLLSGGKVHRAAVLLTRPHEVTGVVGSGAQRGRTIGYPTANLQVPQTFQTPGIGVYLCGARIGASTEIYTAMVNIGTNPTFGGTQRSIEAYLLDFSGELLGHTLSLYFMQRLRDEQRFSGVEALVKQLDHDRDQSRTLWASPAVRDLAQRIPPPVIPVP